MVTPITNLEYFWGTRKIPQEHIKKLINHTKNIAHYNDNNGWIRFLFKSLNKRAIFERRKKLSFHQKQILKRNFQAFRPRLHK